MSQRNHVATFDSFFSEEESGKSSATLQNSTSVVSAACALASLRQDNWLLAVLLGAVALTIVVAAHGRYFSQQITGLALRFRRRRGASRYRGDLRLLIGQFLDSTSTSRSDAITYLADDLRIVPDGSIHPTSLAEMCSSDYLAMEETPRLEEFLRGINQLRSATQALNNFVRQSVRTLKSDEWQEKLTADKRERVNQALGRWNKYLADLEDFLRKLDAEYEYEFRPYFEHAIQV